MAYKTRRVSPARTDASVQRLYDRIAGESLGNWLDERIFRLTENSPYRQQAIDRLQLPPDAAVLDLACGAGQNFKLLRAAGAGELLGVDISRRSLQDAAARIRRQGWTNARLLNTPIADFHSEPRFDAALCTFAMCIIPNYEQAVDRLMGALKPRGRWAILCMQPSGKHPLLDAVWVWMNRRYAGGDVRRDVAAYVRATCGDCQYETCFGGFYYLLSGQKIS
jgi:ubiquinone/menaquinone biosynthesis C-methylase UbiE